jgi:hypothetical protein
MNLNEAQRQRVAAWVADGLKLSEIQSKIAVELGIRLTYMEVRFLVDDLKLTPKDHELAKPAAPIAATAAEPQAPAALEETAPSATPGAVGGVSLTVSKLARPGTLVSGSVTFSDGMSPAFAGSSVRGNRGRASRRATGCGGAEEPQPASSATATRPACARRCRAAST